MRALLLVAILIGCGGAPASLDASGEYFGGFYQPDAGPGPDGGVPGVHCYAAESGPELLGTWNVHHLDGTTVDGRTIYFSHYDLCDGYASSDLRVYPNEDGLTADGVMQGGQISLSGGRITPSTIEFVANGLGLADVPFRLKRTGARQGKPGNPEPPL